MGTVSDTDDYGELSITRNVKITIECFYAPVFIEIYSGLCISLYYVEYPNRKQ